MSLQIGDRIDGKYEIKRLLGEGGMGAVYEGENTLIHRRVAIKVLHASVATVEEAVLSQGGRRQRFLWSIDPRPLVVLPALYALLTGKTRTRARQSEPG